MRKHPRYVWFGLLITIMLISTSCNLNSPETELEENTLQSTSQWGEIITLAQAEQSDAPTILPINNDIVTAWVELRDEEVVQVMRDYDFEQSTESFTQSIVSVYSHQQRIFPASSNFLHLLWLDAQHDDIGAGQRLWSVPISSELVVERGQILLSDRQVYRYTALPSVDNGVTIIFSGGIVAEPALYIQQIDRAGRPNLLPERIQYNGDYPALLQTNDDLIHLFWMRVTDNAIFHANLRDGVLENILNIGDFSELNRGDRVHNFTVGVDDTHFYFFWNIARVNGSHETWYSSVSIGQNIMRSPQRLGITINPELPFETGFNGGAGVTASSGDNWANWSVPLDQQFSTLPLVTQINDTLGVIYFQNGDVIGYQEVVSLTHNLIGLPQFKTDIDRHLYISWSEPTEGQYANLNMTTTR